MTRIPELEIHSALLALPFHGPLGLLGLGGVAPSMLWAASRGAVRCGGGSILERFHQALALGATVVEADAGEWAALQRVYPLPGPVGLSAFERAQLGRLHEGFSDGAVAALLNQERGGSPERQAGYDRVRRLFVGHGAHVRALRAEAERQLDEGVCDGAAGRVDARRVRREAAYRLGVASAERGADPRPARLRVEARRALRDVT